MHILILYHSRGGKTRHTAESIAEAARGFGHNVTVKSVIEVRQADIDQAERVFIGTWVQGFILFGVKPAAATLWVAALPALTGKSVAVFCTYAFNPRRSLDKLSDLLTARGAKVIAKQAFQRNRLDAGVSEFVQRALASGG